MEKEWKKNEIVELKVEALGSEGEGISHFNGYTLFIKDTVPGDIVLARIIKTKKTYGYARMEKLLTASPDRVPPRCPVARQCGGCQLQHLSYEGQLRYKQQKVVDCLVRIGGLDAASLPIEPIIGMKEPWNYRNKAQFPVGRTAIRKGGETRITIGFYAGHTHSIIDTSYCYIQTERNEKILRIVREFMEEYGIQPYKEETQTGLVRHILTRVGFATQEIGLCLILNGKELPHQEELCCRLRKEVKGIKSISLNANQKATNVILGEELIPLYGDLTIRDFIGNVQFQISPLSFYQVNPVQTEILYGKVLEYANLTGKEVVWDLYCGIGTISLFLARHAKLVYGVEIVPAAIEDAKKNAKLNLITNAYFSVGAAEQVASFLPNPDIIVVDPPRKGCDAKLLETILSARPERVIYVSCDPATLARDVKRLVEGGYEVRNVQPVDMFPQTSHVETVVQLSHKKPDSVINVKVEFGEGEGKVPLDNIAKRAAAYKPKERVTYKMIKEYIEAKYGFKVHTAYIAEVKRELGLPMYDASNAVEELKQPRKHPTEEKVEAIKDALEFFELI